MTDYYQVKREIHLDYEINRPITLELALFLGVEPTVWMTRNVVSKHIISYIMKNKLCDVGTYSEIQYNYVLYKLFNLDNTEKLTFFNLHNHIQKLFIT